MRILKRNRSKGVVRNVMLSQARRICTVLMCLCIGTLAPGISQRCYVYGAEVSDGMMDLLGELKIMTGDPNGDLRLNDGVTRAEFTKVAVAASSYKDSVAANLSISPFQDVTYQHWAAPYVRVGVTNGVVSGYPDATFRPDEPVLYEEAITMMLRVLGYTDADFGVSWPYGQIGLATNLDMTEGVDCSAGQNMNRSQVARLVYNTLNTKQKGQAAKLVSIFDVELKEDITLVASSTEDSSLASDEIFTTEGSLKIDANFDRALIGLKGDAAVKNGNKLVSFIPDQSSGDVEDYVVYSLLDNKIMAYRGGTLSQVDIADDTTVYKGKTQTTFAGLKSQLEMGDHIKVRITDGEVDYVTFGKGDIKGPVTVHSSDWGTSWNINDSTIITRDGVQVSKGEIKTHDVLYYLPDLNMVFAYVDKVTGVYEKAEPNRDMPTQVTVSGNTYEIEGSEAFHKLATGGSYEYGDTITLLLGKTNKIADVISPAATDEEVVGYLMETGTKEYSSGQVNTYSAYYVKVALSGGESYEYVSDRNYSEWKNAVVRLSFTDEGYARLTNVTQPTNISGVFNWDSKRLGSSKLASSVSILDVGTRDSNKTGCYAKIYPQRLNDVNISAKAVLYAEKNSEQQIVKLILDNVTNDAYQFGVVTKAENNNKSVAGKYQFIVDGTLYDVNTNGTQYSLNKGGAVKIGGSPANPELVMNLLFLSEKVTNINETRLTAGNKSYLISDKVAVYRKSITSTTNYTQIPFADIIGKKDLKLSVYYDKEAEQGGRIRVIIVTD